MPGFARVGWVKLCVAVSVALVTAGLGVSAGWAQQPQGAAGSQSGPSVAPSSPPGKPVGVDREALRRFVAERDQARRDKKAARDSEGGRRERRASRTRYRDLDRGQARELARKHFKRTFERRDLVKRPGVSVDAYLGERAARVQLATGQKAIVESLAPLRTPDGSGELEPIDLTLRDAGDAFAPVHGASKLRLPKRLRGGDVELGDSGVRIDIPAPQSDTPGSAEDGGVFYANAEASTDVAVVPEMAGVEVSYLLRSAEAPERFVLSYGGGVTLREAKEGGVDVLRDGKLLAQVTPPRAWDADGQPVPMRLQADGDQLVIEVDHRDGDYAYPIVADPYTGEDFAYYDGRTAWWDQTGWDRVSTAGSANPRRFFEDQQCTDTGGRFCFGHWPGWIYGTGLYTWMRAGYTPGFNNTYNYGDIGEWIYQAPGQSYIFRFDMWQLHNEYDSSCSYQGLFSPRSNSWEEQSYWDPWGGAHTPARVAGDYPPRMSCGTSNTDWLAVCAGQWECRNGEADYGRHIREGGNYAVFGTQIPNTRVPSFTNFMGAANISIGDRDTPQINTLTGPTGWTNDTGAQITASASDPGLGVRQLKLSAPDQPDWNGTRDSAPACNGDRNSRCSTWRSHTVDTGNLREGRNRILAEATDPVDHQSPPREINVAVDRSAPVWPADFSASGAINTDDGNAALGWAEAQDPAAADGAPLSGVTAYAIRYRTSGTAAWTSARTQDPELRLSGRRLGETLDLEMTAIDSAGNAGPVIAAQVRLDAMDSGSEPKDINDNDDNLSSETLGDGITYVCSDDCNAGSDGSSSSTSSTSLRSLPQGDPAWGLSDNNPQFDDPNQPGFSAFDIFPTNAFRDLEIEQVRLIVPWNTALLGPGSFDYDNAAQWIAKASDANQPGGAKRILISFDKCRTPPRQGVVCDDYYPTGIEYRAAIDRFLIDPSLGPKVRDFTPWNEPNKTGTKPAPTATVAPAGTSANATNSGAFASGAFWQQLRGACDARPAPKCNVAAGDFLDTTLADPAGSSAPFSRRFFDQYVAGMSQRRPVAWAIHSYSDAAATRSLADNEPPRFTRLRRFLAATRSLNTGATAPNVWMTEQGAIRELGTRRNSELCQARIARFILRAPSIDDRIKRFYYYHLRGEPGVDWALVRANNSRRPVYSVLRSKTATGYVDSTNTQCP